VSFAVHRKTDDEWRVLYGGDGWRAAVDLAYNPVA
jgi:hypothetical protein